MSLGALRPGVTVGGHAIVRKLGEGGMGAVFEARDAAGRAVALKVIVPERAGDARLVERFVREGQLAASVRHGNVVAVLGAGEDRGLLFLVQELVPGGSLDDRLKREGRLPWREACALAARVARGLSAVHAAGLVHRDLKPANVLLDAQGPKVGDFGLARRVDSRSLQELTKTGEIVGTLHYIAPEQVDSSKAVGPAADLYSLGGLLFALLTGGPPFDGPQHVLLKKHLLDAPPSPRDVVPDVPAAVDALVRRLLAKTPAERPASAAEVAGLLEALAVGESAAPAPRRRGLAVAGVVSAAVLVGALLAWRGSRDAPAGPAPPAPTEAPTERPVTTTRGLGAPAVIRSFSSAVLSLAASPDGQALLVGCRDGTVHGRRDGSWKVLGQREAPEHGVRAIACAPRRPLAVSAGDSPQLDVWSTATLTFETTLGGLAVDMPQQHVNTVRALAFGPRGHLLSGGQQTADQRVVLWTDTRTPTRLSAMPNGVDDGITAAAMSPDGEWGVTGGESGQLHRWDVGHLAEQPTDLFAPSTQPVRSPVVGLGFTSNDRLVSADADGWLRTWSVRRKEEVEGPVRLGAGVGAFVVTTTARGAIGLTGDVDGRITLWDLDPPRPGPSVAAPAGPGRVRCLASAKGRVWAGTDGGAVLEVELLGLE